MFSTQTKSHHAIYPKLHIAAVFLKKTKSARWDPRHFLLQLAFCVAASAAVCTVCVCIRGVDTDRVSPTLLKVTLTVWITVLLCFLAAHTHKDTQTRHRSHIAFRWRAPPTPSVRGQLIINLPAKWYYISSRARHWPRGSPKQWQRFCLPPNKVKAVAW